MDCQQGFIVGVSGRGRPIEGTSDHSFVVDHGELVMELVTARKARAANAFEGLIQRLITRFYLAGVIRKADPQQIEQFREVSARKTRIGDQPDFNASLDLFTQDFGELLCGEYKQGYINAFFGCS